MEKSKEINNTIINNFYVSVKSKRSVNFKEPPLWGSGVKSILAIQNDIYCTKSPGLFRFSN